jgi:peptidoglycan hydrolase CwlO-like protein
MPFIIVLMLTTFAIAASAAYFSVYGLAHLFTGALIPVIIMGSSLEAGKLVAASFLYRYSKKIGLGMKAYLGSAVLVLMLITSMGIFGFLTAAYQSDTLPLAEMTQQITSLKEEKVRITERLAQIDKQIADVGPNYVRAKQRLVKEFATERKTLDTRLAEITPELHKLEQQHVTVKAKVGPIMFIAEVMGKDPNSAVFWFVIILISVFDPLAVALTVATNMAIKIRKEEKQKALEAKEGPKQEVNMDSLKKYIDKKVNQAKEPEPTPTPEPTSQILNENTAA